MFWSASNIYKWNIVTPKKDRKVGVTTISELCRSFFWGTGGLLQSQSRGLSVYDGNMEEEKYIALEFRIHLPPWLFNMAMGNGP